MQEDPIILQDWTPAWTKHFAEECGYLQSQLGDRIVLIAHVGSTAVPGMPSKPVIDILIEIDNFPPTQGVLARLREAGYAHKGERGVPGRYFFKKGRPRSHHLHVVAEGSNVGVKLLRFRDSLRADPHLAKAYIKLKRSLAKRFRGDRDAYTHHKTEFVESVLRRGTI